MDYLAVAEVFDGEEMDIDGQVLFAVGAGDRRADAYLLNLRLEVIRAEADRL